MLKIHTKSNKSQILNDVILQQVTSFLVGNQQQKHQQVLQRDVKKSLMFCGICLSYSYSWSNFKTYIMS